MDHQLLTRPQLDRELRHRTEVDHLVDDAGDARDVARRDLAGGELDLLGPDRHLELVGTRSGTRAVGRHDALAVAQVHDRHRTLAAVDADVDQVRDTDEAGHERRRGPLVELARRRDLLDDAVLHDRDAVGHRQRLLLIVRDVDERRLRLRLEVLQLELQLLAELQVEGAERLVEQQGRGPVDERAGQRDALLLAAGELAGLALLEVLEAHRPDRLLDALLRLLPADLLDLQPERDVVPHRHVREQRVGLEHHVHVAPGRRART